MALVICPECSGPVSDSVVNCPYCGYAIVSYFTHEREVKEKAKEKAEEEQRFMSQRFIIKHIGSSGLCECLGDKNGFKSRQEAEAASKVTCRHSSGRIGRKKWSYDCLYGGGDVCTSEGCKTVIYELPAGKFLDTYAREEHEEIKRRVIALRGYY